MISESFSFGPEVLALSEQATQQTKHVFEQLDSICEINTQKVMAAFMQHRIGESHLQGTSGYGYGDRGRDALDAVFAQIMGAEDALVRHHFASGTSTISTALFGVLRPGDTVVCLTGTPYDTLHSVIGIGKQQGVGSLQEFGIHYRQLDLKEDGSVDMDGIAQAVQGAKVAYIQRSRGYSMRPSLSIEAIKEIIAAAKQASPDIIAMVDNCYGEFVETQEPCHVGADLIMGSLIKNPGGGIAQTGGYIAGRADLVELCAHRLTAPGVGREVGCSLNENKHMFMGLFFAPSVVCAAVKTAVFAASVFGAMGFDVSPQVQEHRADIIQAVVLGDGDKLSAFCRGIQMGAPIDSYVTPVAWEMPGYDDPVIMAAGAFSMGSSIELSADGPMREPFAAWMQGGLTFPSGKLGVLWAAQELIKERK